MKKTVFANKEVKIYTIELLVFALIYFVLGVLILVGVIPLKGTFRHVLIYISLVGAAWFVFDFFWTLFSKKRRKTSSLFDKGLILPAVVGVVVVDILTFVMGFEESNTIHVYFTGAFFCYLTLIFVMEAIYHIYHPLPALLEEEEGKPKDKEESSTEGNKEVTPEEKKKEEEDFQSKLKALEEKKDEDKKE